MFGKNKSTKDAQNCSTRTNTPKNEDMTSGSKSTKSCGTRTTKSCGTRSTK